MKYKDNDWYQDKVQDIKKRKRQLHVIQDPELVKKMKKDLKREQRAAKRAERRNINIYIEKEINEYYERNK